MTASGRPGAGVPVDSPAAAPASRAHQPEALGDVEGLADGVGVPVGVGPGLVWAPGVKRTGATVIRDGSSPLWIGVTSTSPLNARARWMPAQWG